MPPFLDARLPLLFADAAAADAVDGLLVEGDGTPRPGLDYFAANNGHAVGCACCAPRNAAGMALSRLLLARARGQGPFFRRVVAVTSSAAGREAVLHAIATDPLASACFKLADPASLGVSPEERGE